MKVHPFQSSGFRCVNLHPYSAEVPGGEGTGGGGAGGAGAEGGAGAGAGVSLLAHRGMLEGAVALASGGLAGCVERGKAVQVDIRLTLG